MLYPLQLTPHYRNTYWGGNILRSAYHKSVPFDNCGESWEVSTIQDYVSEIKNGYLEENTLEETIEVYMGEMVGDAVYEKFGVEFPLLVKLINTALDTPLFVNPDNAAAKKRHNAYGNTMLWYILNAKPDAYVYYGLNKETDKSEWQQRVLSDSVAELIQKVPVESGDVLFIPAGTVYGIGAGVVLLQVQQTSDVAYQINNPDKQQAEELIHEWVKDTVDFKQVNPKKIAYTLEHNKTSALFSGTYFTVNKLQIDALIRKDYFNLDSFVIYVCTQGACTIRTEDNEQVRLQAGQVSVLPAILNDIEIKPEKEAELIEIYIK